MELHRLFPLFHDDLPHLVRGVDRTSVGLHEGGGESGECVSISSSPFHGWPCVLFIQDVSAEDSFMGARFLQASENAATVWGRRALAIRSVEPM